MRRAASVAVLIFALALVLAATGCSSSGTPSGTGGSTGSAASGSTGSGPAGSDSASPAEIVSAVCTRCHSTARIKAADHDAAAWKVTIDRMRGKGAAINDAQESKVIEFLAGGGAAQL